MADLLTSIRAEIDARLDELRPVLAEYEELLSVLDALSSDGRSAPGRSASGPGRRAQSTIVAPQRSGASARARSPRPKARSTKARPTVARRTRKRERRAHGPTGQAILAALEHGSHTPAELVTVTALSASDIRESLRRLRKHGAIVKADRDGKAAYALPAPAPA